MIRRLCMASLWCAAAFTLVMLLARLQPFDDLSAYFGDCDMPCWQMVHPGVTMRTDALARLKALGWQLKSECNPAVYNTCYDFMRAEDDPVAFVYIADEQVRQIALFHTGLRLGDLWLAFGAPDIASISPRSYRADFLNTAVWFGPGGVSTRQRFPCPAGFAGMLRLPVDALLIWSPDTSMTGSVFNTTADLRRAIFTVCSA